MTLNRLFVGSSSINTKGALGAADAEYNGEYAENNLEAFNLVLFAARFRPTYVSLLAAIVLVEQYFYRIRLHTRNYSTLTQYSTGFDDVLQRIRLPKNSIYTFETIDFNIDLGTIVTY